jgi:ribosomal protein S14
MLFSKVHDHKLRKQLQKKEVLKNAFKYTWVNFLNKTKNKGGTCKGLFMSNLSPKYSKTKIVRRCILNNRARGLTKPYNISRTKLREMIQFGVIPGYKKSV